MMPVRAERIAHFVSLVVLLGAIAWASPLPQRVTDRDIYEATAAHGVVQDCSDIHCFRVLVPWLVAPFPGASILKWKIYAVLANAAAGVAVFALTLSLGVGRPAAWFASTMSAFGFGSLYTLHDVYSSDPLMYFLGPFLTNEMIVGRFAVASAVGAAGVMAKEFAAAPFYLMTLSLGLARRWSEAARALVAGNAVFIVWFVMTLTLMLRFNYTYAGSPSADLGGGANLVNWVNRQSARGIAAAMFNEFGVLYILTPVGFFLAPRRLQLLSLASLPIAGFFGYVQQPDRALWNLHFLVTPMAALVLERAPMLGALTVGAFIVGNLRVGAQLPLPTVGKLALATSMVLGAATIVAGFRSSTS